MLQVVRDAGREFLGFLDDRESDSTLLSGIGAEWLGPISEFGRHQADYLIGIGSGIVRRSVDARLDYVGATAATLVHPMSSVGPDVRLSPGVVIFAFATVTTNIRLGRHTHVGRGAAVGHDSTLGDFVTTYPLSAVSGNVTLEDEVTLGTTASIKQGINVGARTTIGSGAAVVSDLPSDVVATGVPARPREDLSRP